jgi:hypothetical protein
MGEGELSEGAAEPSRPAWQVRLPLTEARYLSGASGPLSYGGRHRDGAITHLGDGVVRLDGQAFGWLAGLPGHVDGHMSYDGDTPVLGIGGTRYPVERSEPTG